MRSWCWSWTACWQLEVAGERYRLDAGDALHYPTDRPYEWHNPGPAPLRAVWFTVRV